MIGQCSILTLLPLITLGPGVHVLIRGKFNFGRIKLERGEEKEIVMEPDFRAFNVFGLSRDGGPIMEVSLYSIIQGGKRIKLGEDGSVTLINIQDKEESMNCSERRIYKDEDRKEMHHLMCSINPGIEF